MSGINILRRLLLKDAALGSGQASGIMSIGDSVRDLAEKRLQSYLMSAQKQGVDIDKFGEQELKYMLEMNKPKPPKVIAADSPEGKGITQSLFGKKGEVFNLQGEKLDPNLPISGGTQQGKKINREFFERAAEAQEVEKRIKSGVAATVEKMLRMEPLDAMKEANKVIKREGPYKNLSKQEAKQILDDTEDHIFDRVINVDDIDPEDFAGGGVAGMLGERPGYREGGPGQLAQRGKRKRKPTEYYTDKIIRDNIGRIKNDLLLKYILPNQRDRFFENIKPEDMYTTFDEKDGYSGLMYKGLDNPSDKGVDALGLLKILKEPGSVDKDYDVRDMKPFDKRFYFDDQKGFVEGYELKDGGRPGRQNFKMGRRAFLKMLAGTGAGIAGLKTGITGLGGKKVATEVAKEAVTTSGGTPPPYFFNLVKKIKNLGDDVTSKSATTERQKVTKYKDYELTEDLTTGEQTIQKKSIKGDFDTSVPTSEEVYMNYKPGKGQADEVTGKVADEYVEDTSYVGTSRGDKGEIVDTVDGVPDEVIQEGTVFEDDITDFTTKKLRKKKAGGGVAYMLGQ
jgi:hypothetical protein